MGNKANDITGKVFGGLKVLCRDTNAPPVYWRCLCECGRECSATTYWLVKGEKTHCGCKRRQPIYNLPEYQVWKGIKKRCNNPKEKCYARYGGRGIKVSPEWCKSFNAFLSDMGRRPSKEYSIERKNNDGDYCKENCSWQTLIVQANNTRRNRFIELDGQKRTLSQWARLAGVTSDAMAYRLKHWDIHDALTRASDYPRQNRKGNACIHAFETAMKGEQ